MEQKTGLFVGLNHGFVITKPAKNATKAKIATRKGKLGKRVAAVRQVIREVVGFTPLERKMMEMIRTGVPAKEKRANKLAKARLGSYKRSLVKRAMIDNILAAQRKRWAISQDLRNINKADQTTMPTPQASELISSLNLVSQFVLLYVI